MSAGTLHFASGGKRTAEESLIEMLIEDLAERVTKRIAEKLANIHVPQKMLYNIDEAKIYLGRSESAVRHLIDSREFPCVRIGGRVQISKRVMDEWIEHHTV